METIYSAVSMTAKLPKDEAVLLTFDLATGSTFHHVFRKTGEKPSSYSDGERFEMSKSIVDTYKLAQLLGGSREMQMIDRMMYGKLGDYITSSQAYEALDGLDHNVILMLIDYNNNDHVVRMLGTYSSSSIQDALNDMRPALQQAYSLGWVTFKNDKLTMMGLSSPNARVYAPNGNQFKRVK